jgi:F0F1-type ATP synthase membrane subunit c/vacuolar-type H+-ATPase subunit K
LRYLTHEMRGESDHWLRKIFRRIGKNSPSPAGAASLFDHNIAQALMLLMEGERKDAKSIAAAALEMAVKRSTNDNTIRYVGSSVFVAFLACLISATIYFSSEFLFADATRAAIQSYSTVAFFGVLGAVFSVATRVRSFQAKPCQQSNMNYIMARLRIGIGLVSAIMLYLTAGKLIGGAVFQPEMIKSSQGMAIIGFLGGFAERLVPTIFRRAAEAFEEASGTPVQQARLKPVPSGE